MSTAKEATARIKINKLLEEAGWRFFEEAGKPTNISIEPGVALEGWVATNRERILRFEKEIRVTLSRIWGDDASEAFKCPQHH